MGQNPPEDRTGNGEAPHMSMILVVAGALVMVYGFARGSWRVSRDHRYGKLPWLR